MSYQRATGHAVIVAIAALTVLANLAFGVSWQLALTAGGAVFLFGEGASRLPRRRVNESAAPDGNQEPSLPPAYPLTRKELEVAVLVAYGNSNKAIAAQLFNSERTIDNHVQHIYNKLDIDSRPELALWMREHGLLKESTARKSSTQ
jgi:DNA-binding NarL/FixJ family response regulator